MNTAETYAYSWRTKAATGAILMMAALGAGTLIIFRTFTQNATADTIVSDEQRFDTLRELLPERGVVGYVSDRGEGQDGVRAYYRAQYSLTPLVVAPDKGREFVVANFSSPNLVAPFAAAQGLVIMKDFGNGVALLRQARR